MSWKAHTTGEAVHIHPDMFNHVFCYKNGRNRRITLVVSKTWVRMLRVKGYRYKKAGHKRKEVYPGITWKSYIINSLSTLEQFLSCMFELLQACPFKLLPTLFSQGAMAVEMKIELS